MIGREDLAFRDRAVYLPSLDVLVLSDLHVGRAEASDVAFPVGERDHLHGRLAALLDAFDPETVVFAGDVLHSYGHVPVVARDTLSDLVALVDDAGADLVATPGNHDPQLADVLDAPTPAAYADGDLVVCHGHEEPDAEGGLYVVGHDHPTIDIEGQRRPAYLYGTRSFRNGDVLVLPSFTELAAGVEVNRMRTRDFASPLVTDANALRPVVYDADVDEALWFPPLGDLQAYL
ncbi:metallophosphoesterase [Halorubellus sp. JP-L1]|uniref:metallophosphoesterase n=1 Tax=Halorubellus sp. JP-L1 TaxID=2715753 RepID=UPI00140885DF|nr:metallophosphoesterase [Halorubellus sp. JP-L1]NHN42358.1 metallophosphoesterase [Halorubellus sp. JP-L1]